MDVLLPTRRRIEALICYRKCGFAISNKREISPDASGAAFVEELVAAQIGSLRIRDNDILIPGTTIPSRSSPTAASTATWLASRGDQAFRLHRFLHLRARGDSVDVGLDVRPFCQIDLDAGGPAQDREHVGVRNR